MATSEGKGQQSAARADRSIWFIAGIPGLALPAGRSADGRPEWSQLGPAAQLLQLWGESTNRLRTGIVPHPTHTRPQEPPPLFSSAGRGKSLEVVPWEEGNLWRSPRRGDILRVLPPVLHRPQ